MNTPKKFTAQHLSEPAQAVVHRMLDQKRHATAIARAVSKATGEKITRSSIARYATHYASLQKERATARMETETLVRKIKASGSEVSDMLRAAFHESFEDARKRGALLKMNPLRFEAAERRRLELAIKKKQVSLAQRRVRVFEDRLKLDRKKAQAAISKLDRKARKGESLSAEDVRQIREIYGLSEAFENDWNLEERALRALEAESEESETTEDDHNNHELEDGEKRPGGEARR